MRIIIATVQVPFIEGGAEVHAAELRAALRRKGHEAEIVAIPFKWYPPEKILDHMLACRLLDLTEVNGLKIDRLIGLKFPAYLIPHPHKVLWVLHQHRSAYELWDHELSDMIYYANALEIRDAIRRADQCVFAEAKAIYANSRNVSDRLMTFCGVRAIPLYHPPRNAEKFYALRAEEYLFFPSRICRPKRQRLVIEALKMTVHPVKVRFAGVPDHPSHGEELRDAARQLGVEDRIEWLGYVTEEEKRELYARALGVVYPPMDEDYGYVTLEAMLSSKPIITCTDSGGPLEFVIPEETGLIVPPDPRSMAKAFDYLWEDKARAELFGRRARELYMELDISWDRVIDALLA